MRLQCDVFGDEIWIQLYFPLRVKLISDDELVLLCI